ncbi:MAG TPA: prepilin-type N-terminal cleavage/methylation domain-containing protein, partial [Candidatus Ozemobacteraceae bacterium]|nr:prepilin-type N-terminal cleavage/methylation domain-containing protein [Candidatus Ozemobacteraceae bacterium]
MAQDQALLTHTRDILPGRKRAAGFTIVEIVIAMFILAVFLLPLMQHFVRARRVSLAARDAVIANSFQTSCLGELRLVDYNDLLNPTGATCSRVLERYSGDKTVDNLTIQTDVAINEGVEAKMLTIDVKSEFRFPGSPEGHAKRKICMRGYVFPKP